MPLNDHSIAALVDQETTRRPDREGKRRLMVHVDPVIYHHFKVLGAEQDSTTDAMMHEALWLLFERYNELETLRRKLTKPDGQDTR